MIENASKLDETTICEWAPYENDSEKQKAIEYLDLFTHFFRIKNPNFVILETQFIVQPSTRADKMGRLVCKIRVKSNE